MKNYNYITIHGWMHNELNLSGNALQVYAIIFGFCQDEESEFSGSIKYLSDCVGTSKRTIIRTLQHLTDIKLLIRQEIIKNNVKYVIYKINFKMLDYNRGGGDKMSPGGSDKMSPNNTSSCLIDKNIVVEEQEQGQDSKDKTMGLSLFPTTPTTVDLENKFLYEWNRFCDKSRGNTCKCRCLSDSRKRKLKKIIQRANIFRKQDGSGKEIIEYIFSEIIYPVWNNNPYYQGLIPNKKYDTPYRFTIDRVLKEDTFIDMVESVKK